MTNGIEQYIRETAEVEREELIAFGKERKFSQGSLYCQADSPREILSWLGRNSCFKRC